MDSWETVMRRGYVHRTLLWGQLGGASNRVAMQLSERRLRWSVPRPLSPTPLLDGQLAISPAATGTTPDGVTASPPAPGNRRTAGLKMHVGQSGFARGA